MSPLDYSIIIPVYNRPDEVGELLDSLTRQAGEHRFEVIVVDDGSTTPIREVVNAYAGRLDIHYYYKPNSGPGLTRNYGAHRATGRYLLILDSDCVVPPDYLSAIDHELAREPVDAFGGPDRAHPDFTPTQRAIGYAMTSFFTTGGIRGGRHKLDTFFPRSFNMGISHEAYDAVGGFADMRFGEDIDLSMRLLEAGYHSRLFPEAWVWHKRRTHFGPFFKQVHNSGIARIHLSLRHPGSLKWVHTLPAVFTTGCVVLLLLSPWCPWALLPIALFAVLFFIDSMRAHRGQVGVALRSVVAAFVQLIGYGTGFLRAWWQRRIRKKGEFDAFRHNFYQ